MIWPGQTATAEARGLHSEVAPIFLHQHIGGNFRRTEQTVHGVVDRHRLRNPIYVRVRGVDLPASFLLDQWEEVRRVSIHLVGRYEDEDRVRSKLARRFEKS